MERVFDDNDRYGPVAMDLDQEFRDALAPIFEVWHGKGYSIRDIAHVAHGAVFDRELSVMMDQFLADRGNK